MKVRSASEVSVCLVFCSVLRFATPSCLELRCSCCSDLEQLLLPCIVYTCIVGLRENYKSRFVVGPMYDSTAEHK